MKYTKQDFEAIAGELRYINESLREGRIKIWVAKFKEANPRFDEVRFRAACNLYKKSLPKSKKSVK